MDSATDVNIHDAKTTAMQKVDAYIDIFFPQVMPSKTDKNFGWLYFYMEELLNAFKADDFTGADLLDISTGGNIVPTAFGSRRFKNIYWADYSSAVRDNLHHWLSNPSDDERWKDYMNYIADIEGNQDGGQAIANRLRSAVKQIYACNLLAENPLHPLPLRQFDYIISYSTVEAASKTTEEYEKCVTALYNLTKPGGHIRIEGTLRCHFANIGGEICSTLYYDLPFAIAAFEKAGFRNVVAKDSNFPWADYNESTLFYLTATK